MKYKCTVEINAPLDKVVSLWQDEKYFKDWQDDFESIELLSGKLHSENAKSKIIFNGKHHIELIETIITNNLPKEKLATYEHKHMTNSQKTSFESLGKNKTLYISEVDYTQFNGILIKLMAKIFPGKFKAQSQKWMNQFKEFTEKNINK